MAEAALQLSLNSADTGSLRGGVPGAASAAAPPGTDEAATMQWLSNRLDR